MIRFKLKVLFFLALTIQISSITNAALIQLKNGQMVEGEFIGASPKEVSIKIASQTLKFKITEISQILFDKSATSAVVPGDDSFKTGAKSALRALSSLESVVESGVSYGEYSKRVLDAKIIIDEFIGENKDLSKQEFNEILADTIGYYSAASSAWNAKIIGSHETPEVYLSLVHNEYCLKCSELQAILKEKSVELKYKPGSYLEGMTISFFGPQTLWQCARRSKEKAEEYIFKLDNIKTTSKAN